MIKCGTNPSHDVGRFCWKKPRITDFFVYNAIEHFFFIIAGERSLGGGTDIKYILFTVS